LQTIDVQNLINQDLIAISQNSDIDKQYIVFPDSNSEGTVMLYNIYSLIPVNKIEAH